MKHKVTLLILALACSLGTSQSVHKDMYIFGHSLINYAGPNSSNETTVPHWMALLAQAAGNTHAATGQYGFLPTHDNDFPPQALWGYSSLPSPWDEENEAFGDADMYNVMITAGNFRQGIGPDVAFDDDNNPDGDTPISSTVTIMDWLATQEDDSLTVFIYENWPEMSDYVSNGWPASPSEFATYQTYLQNGFHDWWIDYYEGVRSDRPNADVRLVPVGSVISELLDGILSNISVAELYFDADPHGTETTYFLAGLISYMAVYGEQAPAGITIPVSVHQEVRDNYIAVNNFIWQELNNFTDSNGINRVFGSQGSPPEVSRVEVKGGALFINDDAGLIIRGRDGLCYNIYVDGDGDLVHVLVDCPE